MSDKKIIDYRLYNPTKAIFGSKKDRAKFTTISCSNSENCSLFSKGQCIMWSGLWGNRCEFGFKNVETGFTPRAKSFNSWINERKNKVKDIKQLSAAPDKLVEIGERIYFPYPHWYLLKTLPEELSGSAFNSKYYIPKSLFTTELLRNIIQGRPYAMMGGEIISYQNEVVPKIVQHLKEEMPDFYNKLNLEFPDILIRFKDPDYIGRSVYLKTIVKNIPFTIERKGECIWDGENLIFEDFNLSFAPVKGKHKVITTPDENETVIVTDNVMVYKNTKFKD